MISEDLIRSELILLESRARELAGGVLAGTIECRYDDGNIEILGEALPELMRSYRELRGTFSDDFCGLMDTYFERMNL
jgi:hypothetical protein